MILGQVPLCLLFAAAEPAVCSLILSTPWTSLTCASNSKVFCNRVGPRFFIVISSVATGDQCLPGDMAAGIAEQKQAREKVATVLILMPAKAEPPTPTSM